jgi:hypothetical protein
MLYVHTKFGENRPTGSKAEITCARTPQHVDGPNLLRFCSQEGKQADRQSHIRERRKCLHYKQQPASTVRKIIATYCENYRTQVTILGGKMRSF